MYSLCSGGGAQPIIEPKSSGRTFEKLCDIRKYAHPDFLAEVQCNLGGRTIERVLYGIIKCCMLMEFIRVLVLSRCSIFRQQPVKMFHYNM